MDAFYGLKLYENMKEMKDCFYVDLDSEKSDEMLYKCSNFIGNKINQKLEENVIEGFSQRCCPDGMTGVNGTCVEVCQNCDYNDCRRGSSNRGILYGLPVDKKEKKNRKFDEDIFNYVVIDFPIN